MLTTLTVAAVASGSIALGTGGYVAYKKRKKRKLREKALNVIGEELSKHEVLQFKSFSNLQEMSKERETKFILYELGIKSDNPGVSEAFLKKASHLGHVVAGFQIGKSYLNGRFQPQSEEVAQEWFEKAANQHYDEAMIALGQLHKNKGEVGTAKRWFKKASKIGNASAKVELEQLVAESGSAEDQYDLARSLQETDPRTALQWFERAAQQEHTHASYQMAMYYLEGIYVDQNEEQAILYLLSAAKMGHIASAKKLAEIFEERKVYEESLHWYRVCHSLSQEDYQKKISWIEKQLPEKH